MDFCHETYINISTRPRNCEAGRLRKVEAKEKKKKKDDSNRNHIGSHVQGWRSMQRLGDNLNSSICNRDVVFSQHILVSWRLNMAANHWATAAAMSVDWHCGTLLLLVSPQMTDLVQPIFRISDNSSVQQTHCCCCCLLLALSRSTRTLCWRRP